MEIEYGKHNNLLSHCFFLTFSSFLVFPSCVPAKTWLAVLNDIAYKLVHQDIIHQTFNKTDMVGLNIAGRQIKSEIDRR